MVVVVQKNFREPASASASVSASAGPPPLAFTVPVHSWTHCSPDTLECCVVTLFARRPVRLAEGTAGADNGRGVLWEFLWLPADERSGGAVSRPVRRHCVFPHVPLSHLIVRRCGGAETAESDDDDEESLFSLAGGMLGSSRARAPGTAAAASVWAAGAPPAARDCVVFLSPRDVLVYTAADARTSHSAPSVDYFQLARHDGTEAEAEALLQWRRQPAAVQLPVRSAPQPQPPLVSATGAPWALLTLSSLPQQPSPAAAAAAAVGPTPGAGGGETKVLYLLSQPESSGVAPQDNFIVGVVNVAAATRGIAAGHSGSTRALTTSLVHFFEERSVSLARAVEMAPDARIQSALSPTQCHWRLLSAEKGCPGPNPAHSPAATTCALVGVLPVVRVPLAAGAPRGPPEGQESGDGAPNVSALVSRAVPHLHGAVWRPSGAVAHTEGERVPCALQLVVSLQHQNAVLDAAAALLPTGAADADAQDWSATDPEELINALTSTQTSVFTVSLGAPLVRLAGAHSGPAVAPHDGSATRAVFVQFALDFTCAPPHGAAQGLYVTTPAQTPTSWADVARRAKDDGSETRCTRVPLKHTTWIHGRPILLLEARLGADGDRAALSASSPYDVLPTTASCSALLAEAAPAQSAAAASTTVQCIPSRHAISGDWRLSFVYSSARDSYAHTDGATASSAKWPSTLICPTIQDVSELSVAELAESLVETAVQEREQQQQQQRQLQQQQQQQQQSFTRGVSDCDINVTAAATRILRAVWDVAVEERFPDECTALLSAVQTRHHYDAAATSLADAAERTWAQLAATPRANFDSLGEYLSQALRALLTHTDWLPSSGDGATRSFLDQLFRCFATFLLSGGLPVPRDADPVDCAELDVILPPTVRRAVVVAVLGWGRATKPQTGAGGSADRGRCARPCHHWVRRMCFLLLCGGPSARVSFLVEDVFAAAAPSSTSDECDETGVELALLQHVSSAGMLGALCPLAADGPAPLHGLLMPSDLRQLCGAAGPCECLRSAEQANTPSAFAAAAAMTASSPASLVLPFVPMLTDLVVALAAPVADASAVATASQARRVVCDVLDRWERTCATAGAPLACPACLLGGVPWQQWAEYPWNCASPLALFELFSEVAERTQRWCSALPSAEDSPVSESSHDGLTDTMRAWRVYSQRHGEAARELRRAAHVLRWLANGDAGIAEELTHAMQAVASLSARGEGGVATEAFVRGPAGWHTAPAAPLALSAFAVLAHANDVRLLSRASPAEKSPAWPHSSTVEKEHVARVLHLCLASTTGRLCRRLVSEALLDDGALGQSHGAASSFHVLEQIYNECGGRDPLGRAGEDADAEAIADRSEHAKGMTAAPPAPHTLPLQQLAASCWSFAFLHDAEAVMNVVLMEKLLDALLWLRQRVQRPTHLAAAVLRFLRPVFLFAYPQQLRLLEADLLSNGLGTGSRNGDDDENDGATPTADSARPQLTFVQYDSVTASGAHRLQRPQGSSSAPAAALATLCTGEVVEGTRRVLARLLSAFEDSGLALRCLGSLFSIMPSAADMAEHLAAAVARREADARRAEDAARHRRSSEALNDREAGENHDRPCSGEDEEDKDEEEENDGNGADSGVPRHDGDDALASWFYLSPPAAYFFATQTVVTTDVGRLVVTGELLRRELQAYVLSAMLRNSILYVDHRRNCLRGRAFDCRDWINQLADECEVCGGAMGGSAPLWEQALVLLMLDVVEELVVVRGSASTVRSAASCAYPPATLDSTRQCVGAAARKTFATFHADERARVRMLLRAEFVPYLTATRGEEDGHTLRDSERGALGTVERPRCTDAESAEMVALQDYMYSPAHQHAVNVVLPQVRQYMQQLRDAAEEREREESATATATRRLSSSQAAVANPIDAFRRERAVAAAVVAGISEGLTSGLRSALGVPPVLTSSPPRASPAAEGSSLQMQLLLKEESARRRSEEALAASAYVDYMHSDEVARLVATVCFAERLEVYRMALLDYMREHRDICLTFETIYRDLARQARESGRRRLTRAAELRHAAALEALWQAEAEDRATLEAECYAERSAAWACASSQEEDLLDEEAQRVALAQYEADTRHALADNFAHERVAAEQRQLDREEEEEWARMQLEEQQAGAPAPPANAFMRWQEKQLSKDTPTAVAPPAASPQKQSAPAVTGGGTLPADAAPPTSAASTSGMALPVQPAARAPERGRREDARVQSSQDEPVTSGFTRVVEAGEGLLGAFSVFQARLRETVAPAPRRPSDPQPAAPAPVTSAGAVEGKGWKDESRASTTVGTAHAAAPADKGNVKVDDDDWSWHDEEDETEMAQPAPPASQPEKVSATEDGWDWPDADADGDGDAEAPRIKPLAAQAPPAEAKRPPKRRGLGAVKTAEPAVGVPAAPAPPPHPAPTNEASEEGITTSAPARQDDGWGWSDGDDSEGTAAAVVQPCSGAAAAMASAHLSRSPPVEASVGAAPCTGERDGARVAAAASTAPHTPDTARSIFAEISGAATSEHHPTHVRDNGMASPMLEQSRRAAGTPDTEEAEPAPAGATGLPSEVEEAQEALLEEEDVARQHVRLMEVRDYQHFKRSLILSYM